MCTVSRINKLKTIRTGFCEQVHTGMHQVFFAMLDILRSI